MIPETGGNEAVSTTANLSSAHHHICLVFLQLFQNAIRIRIRKTLPRISPNLGWVKWLETEHWIDEGKIWFSRNWYGCHDPSSRMGSLTPVPGHVSLVIQCVFNVQPFHSMIGLKMAKPFFFRKLHLSYYIQAIPSSCWRPRRKVIVEYSKDVISDQKVSMITQYEPMPKDRAHFRKDEYGRKRPILRYYGLFDNQSYFHEDQKALYEIHKFKGIVCNI